MLIGIRLDIITLYVTGHLYFFELTDPCAQVGLRTRQREIRRGTVLNGDGSTGIVRDVSRGERREFRFKVSAALLDRLTG